MRRLEHFSIGVDQGATALFSDFENGGGMWSGTGPRQTRQAVRFSEEFASAPVVHVALSMWDIDSATNARADIRAEDISATGFDIVFRTWGDTRVARIRASWMAIGEITDAEQWGI